MHINRTLSPSLALTRINRALLSSLIIISAILSTSSSCAMLRPTTLHKLKNFAAPHVLHKIKCGVPHMHRAKQQTFNRKFLMLAGIATTGGAAAYRAHSAPIDSTESLSISTDSLNSLTKLDAQTKKELATYYLCTRERYEYFIKKALEARIDLQGFVNERGITPLIAACDWGDLETVKILTQDPGVSIGDKELQFAILSRRTEVTDFLLKHPNLKLRTDKQGLPCRKPYPLGCRGIEGRLRIHPGNESECLYQNYYNLMKEQREIEMQKKLDALCSNQSK